MRKVIIADDEQAIRDGLKVIIPWNDMGYEIAGEAGNGEEVLDLIKKLSPDVVLIDLNMPKLHGTDAIRLAREEGYDKRFIILSGYSDFSYAKTAIRYGVTDYLTKPIDEDELAAVLTRIREEMDDEDKKAGNISTIRTKARDTVLWELITGEGDAAAFDRAELESLDLYADKYQVICYETYHTERSEAERKKDYDLKEILSAVMNAREIEEISDNGKNVVLLKSLDAVRRFELFLKKYAQRPLETDSPLDSIFSGYGRVVEWPSDISVSYKDASELTGRRFFCPKGEHTFGYTSLPELSVTGEAVTESMQKELTDNLAALISAGSLTKAMKLIDSMEETFRTSANTEAQLRFIAADMLISIKERVTAAYSDCADIFPGNAGIIEKISTRFYLYEIFDYFRELTDDTIRQIRATAGAGSTIDDVCDYVLHNYMNDLTLESVAPLFGYNNVYFGKVFAKEAGKSFNSYVNDVRLTEAEKLLKDTDLKIYEISARTGYNDVDYFSKKFRQVVGMSPAEYRKREKA